MILDSFCTIICVLCGQRSLSQVARKWSYKNCTVYWMASLQSAICYSCLFTVYGYLSIFRSGVSWIFPVAVKYNTEIKNQKSLAGIWNFGKKRFHSAVKFLAGRTKRYSWRKCASALHYDICLLPSWRTDTLTALMQLHRYSVTKNALSVAVG
jgi:hypothetical protein